MSAENPALAKLHDYYQPPPPTWTPQTIGWYVLFAIVALATLWLFAQLIRRSLRNRYRRDALRELAHAAPDQFSSVLKRTALAAWPREEVASLSGDAWLSFLNSKTVDGLFVTPPGKRIEEVALNGGRPTVEDEFALRSLAAEWIRRHHV